MEVSLSKMEVLVPCGTAHIQNGSACSLRNFLCPKRKCLFLAELPLSKTEVLVPCGTAYVQNGYASPLSIPIQNSRKFNFLFKEVLISSTADFQHIT
jgi:hypothetical protein